MPTAFINGEPEGFVSPVIDFRDDERSAGASAEFVALEQALGDAVAVVLPTVGVEVVVAKEFEEDTMEFVGAGLGGDIDDAAGGAAELGRVSGGFDFEFPYGFDGDCVGVAAFGGTA